MLKTKSFTIQTLSQVLLVLATFCITSCGAVDKATNKSSLDRAEDKAKTERETRFEAESQSNAYLFMLKSAQKTANFIWVYTIISSEVLTKERANSICSDIGYALPTRTQIAEAEQHEKLAKIVKGSEFGDEVFVADEEKEGRLGLMYALCLKAGSELD